jgi:hypothetical protein
MQGVNGRFPRKWLVAAAWPAVIDGPCRAWQPPDGLGNPITSGNACLGPRERGRVISDEACVAVLRARRQRRSNPGK